MKTVLITGGAGFIGSNYVRLALQTHPDWRVVVYDKLTYAGNLDNLKDVAAEFHDRYAFVKGDIADRDAVFGAMGEHQPSVIINFAADTHVDRSLMEPGTFIMTDVYGTYVLLEAAREFKVERYHQVSTDEVYGQVLAGRSGEDDKLHTRSPYSASKAGGDMMCLAYHASFGVPVTITRGSNNIGPYQYPEKAVPLFITNAIDNLPIPLYGDGLQMRDYQYVLDHCEGIDVVVGRGVPGEIYNVGSGAETRNIDMTHAVLDLLGKPYSLIQPVKDRPGHDRRYALDVRKVESLGWSQPAHVQAGHREDRALVCRQRMVVAQAQERRVPRVLQEAIRGEITLPTMFELTFLGTAASTPAPKRGLPSMVITHDEYRFMVDCGEGTQRQLLNSGLGFRRLEHIFITHPHLDHILGIGGILSTFAQWETLDQISIYGGKSALDRIEDLLFRIVFRGVRPPMAIHLVDVKPGPLLKGEDFDVVAFPVQHRGPDCYGFVFQEHSRRPFLNDKATALGVPAGPERRQLVNGQTVQLPDGRIIQPEDVLGAVQQGTKLAVTGDVGETASLVQVMRGADAIVTEATYSDDEVELARANGHITAGDAARLARDSEARQLILTHISGRHRERDLEDEAKRYFREVVIARDFDTYKIKRD